MYNGWPWVAIEINAEKELLSFLAGRGAFKGGGLCPPPTTGLAPSRIKKIHFKYNCAFITIQLLLKL